MTLHPIIMKNIFLKIPLPVFRIPLLLLVCLALWWPAVAAGTLVYFPLLQIDGSPRTDQFSVTLDARFNPQTDGSHLIGGFAFRYKAGTTNNLWPGGYTLSAPGWNSAKHFNVNDTNVVVNVVNLITNIGSYYPVTIGGGSSGPATNINNATGTNVNLGGVFSGTVNAITANGNYDPFSHQGSPAIRASGAGPYPAILASGGINSDSLTLSFNLYSDAGNFYSDGSGNVVVNSLNIPGRSSSQWTIVDSGFGFNVANNIDGGSFRLTTDGQLYLFNDAHLRANFDVDQVTATNLTASRAIINNGLFWYAVKTNANPSAISAPNGSICTITNGQLFVRSNSVWVPK